MAPADSADRDDVKVALVLGGGGTIGMCYHAGVLRALEQVGGFRPDSADLIVGTSAGSVVAAYLRNGWSTDDFWQMAHGSHPSQTDGEIRREDILAPGYTNTVDLLRRGFGSAFLVGRSLVRLPTPLLPGLVQQAFPGGLFLMKEGRRRFAADLPEAWPSRPLWLCTVDIGSGRRVVLGRASSPEVGLHEALVASCSIPGVYPPLEVGRMSLVDGGARSSTNLDLAAEAGARIVVGVAPLTFDTSRPPGPHVQLLRRLPARRLSAEAALARRLGASVLLVRPSASELRLHGVNLMRASDWAAVAKAAYDATARALETERFRRGLAELHELAGTGEPPSIAS